MATSGGRTLGGYELSEKIRTGRHVAVFSSTDRMGRQVEVACYKASSLRDRTGKDAFLEEARRTAQLHHENLSLLVDVGEEEDIWFAVSVAPEGPSLRDLLDRGGALAEERAELIARSIAQVIDYLDLKGLRHGDIRPETVFLSQGRVLLAPRRLIPLSLSERDARYLAPEEIRVEGTDQRTDYFALGAVLFEALSGQPAFPAESPQEALEAMTRGVPPLPENVTPALRGLAAALLADRPEERPLGAELVGRILSGEIQVAVPGAPPDPASTGTPAPDAVAPGVPPAPPPPPARRSVGRLRVPHPKDEGTWDLHDEETWLGLNAEGEVRIATEEFDGAILRIARDREGDTAHAVPDADPHLRVNGSLADRHTLASGDAVQVGEKEVAYELVIPERTSGGPPARPPNKGSLATAAATVALCLVVLAVAAMRIGKIRARGADLVRQAEEKEESLARSPAPKERGATEEQLLNAEAQRAFRNAKDYAEQDPRAFTANRKAFEQIRSRYGDTMWAYLASTEIERIESQREEALGRAFEELVRQAGLLLDAGRLHDAYLKYHNFAEDHPDTRFGDRADREAVSLLEMQTARFATDLARVTDLEAARDYGTALDLLDQMETYASPEQRQQAYERRREIKRAIHETQITGEEPMPEGPPVDGPPPNPPGPGDPVPGDPVPGDPVPGQPGSGEPEPTTPLESKAQDLFGDAFDAVERQSWDRAIDLLTRLSADPYRSTAYYRDNAEEIAKLLGLSRLERDGPAALFHGRVEDGRGRSIRIIYRFETAEEEEDWTYIKPFADQELGRFDHDGSAMLGKGVGALVHSAVFRADTLEMRARVQAVDPHDIGMMFFEPDEMMRYFLFTVQNRYFTIGAERTSLHENAIFVFGGGAWADTPTGDIGFVKKVTSPKPAVSAGDWLDLVAKKEGQSVSLQIGRSNPLKGSAMGDDRYVFPAFRPAVYVLRSEAVFDEIVLEGELNEGWVRGAMKRARDRYLR